MTISDLVWPIAMAVCTAPIWGTLLWHLYELSVRPRLIPKGEVEKLAQETIALYPDDPEDAAFTQEHAAWYRGEPFEQGKWHRVRKALRKRNSRQGY